jgi:transcriptional regulator with XRE-family HTH domain
VCSSDLLIALCEPEPMEDLRIGAWVRSERRRLGLRQSDLAARAGVGDSTVARLEGGHLSEMNVATARAVAAAVGIELRFQPRSSRNASVERQVDWRHASLVEAVIGRLVDLGWETTTEHSFNDYGDRGSVDVAAWHAERRALLIVEVKSDLRDVQAALHALDIKRRVAPNSLRAARGWDPKTVGVVLVMADLSVERGRVERHAATFRVALPARTVEVRQWLSRPEGPLRGIWFLRIPRPTGAMREPPGHGRVRLPTGAGAAASSCTGGGPVAPRGAVAGTIETPTPHQVRPRGRDPG